MKHFYIQIILIIVLFGCSQQKDEWNEVAKADNLIKYEEYIKANANSSHVIDAYKRMFEIKEIKILEKYFSSVIQDTITGYYDVSMPPIDSNNKTDQVERDDFIEDEGVVWSIYITKNTDFRKIKGLQVGKKYEVTGYYVKPKVISIDSLNVAANLFSRSISLGISLLDEEGKKYVNADSLNNLYNACYRIERNVFRKLANIKEMDDELEILFHYYKIRNETPDSIHNKPLKNMIVTSLKLLEHE